MDLFGAMIVHGLPYSIFDLINVLKRWIRDFGDGPGLFDLILYKVINLCLISVMMWSMCFSNCNDGSKVIFLPFISILIFCLIILFLENTISFVLSAFNPILHLSHHVFNVDKPPCRDSVIAIFVFSFGYIVTQSAKSSAKCETLILSPRLGRSAHGDL